MHGPAAGGAWAEAPWWSAAATSRPAAAIRMAPRRQCFAAVTNVRLADLRHDGVRAAPRSGTSSLGHDAPDAYVAQLRRRHGDFAPFNLVVGDARSVWCLESPRDRAAPGARRAPGQQRPAGCARPKMERLRAGLPRPRRGPPARRRAMSACWTCCAMQRRPPMRSCPTRAYRASASVCFPRSSCAGRPARHAQHLAWRAADGGIGLVERRFGR